MDEREILIRPLAGAEAAEARRRMLAATPVKTGRVQATIEPVEAPR